MDEAILKEKSSFYLEAIQGTAAGSRQGAVKQDSPNMGEISGQLWLQRAGFKMQSAQDISGSQVSQQSPSAGKEAGSGLTLLSASRGDLVMP